MGEERTSASRRGGAPYGNISPSCILVDTSAVKCNYSCTLPAAAVLRRFVAHADITMLSVIAYYNVLPWCVNPKFKKNLLGISLTNIIAKQYSQLLSSKHIYNTISRTIVI